MQCFCRTPWLVAVDASFAMPCRSSPSACQAVQKRTSSNCSVPVVATFTFHPPIVMPIWMDSASVRRWPICSSFNTSQACSPMTSRVQGDRTSQRSMASGSIQVARWPRKWVGSGNTGLVFRLFLEAPFVCLELYK